MSLERRRPAAVARRIITWSLAADAGIGLFVGLAISHIFGLILFLIGLIITGFLQFNISRVFKTRGMRY